MTELRLVDTSDVAELMERFPELRTPLTPAPAAGGEVVELAEVYARQADELARLVEDADRKHQATVRVLLGGLAELHVALDELAHRAAGMGWPA